MIHIVISAKWTTWTMREKREMSLGQHKEDHSDLWVVLLVHVSCKDRRRLDIGMRDMPTSSVATGMELSVLSKGSRERSCRRAEFVFGTSEAFRMRNNENLRKQKLRQLQSFILKTRFGDGVAGATKILLRRYLFAL